MPESADKEIAERAHQIWEREGKPENREGDFWLQAQKELAEEEANPFHALNHLT